MPSYSLEELKKMIRKIEFNKTEHELLSDLVKKAVKVGEGEKERLKRISNRSSHVFKLLNENGFLFPLSVRHKVIEKLRSAPIGAIDGSFQVTGGIGGRWYLVLGISQVIAENGFTVSPSIKVDGFIEPLEGVDDADAKRKAIIVMMMGEIKATLRVAERLMKNIKAYILIDGPVIDPPMYSNGDYIDYRLSALNFCSKNDIVVIGFVKRVMGCNYLNFLRETFENNKFKDFTNDLDLLTSVMFNAVEKTKSPIYTKPICYDEGMKDKKDKANNVYKKYNEKGLFVYYSYYKPNARSRIYRVELASFNKLDEKSLLDIFAKIMTLINQIWTLPGMTEPLLITIAHNKCNVRQGAADTLYYEIMTRSFSEGAPHLWLESL